MEARTFTARRHAFRAILDGEGCVVPAPVFDPVSARLAQEIGFSSLVLLGSVASFSILGAPDLTLLTLSELAERARRISSASHLPLLVDADHGYGNALNVARTINELEAAGAAAVTIEDTLLPKRYGSGAAPELISIEEAAGKIRSALAARADPSLCIVGRTQWAGNLDDFLARLTAFEAAGADALFVTGVSTPDQLAAVSRATALPLMTVALPAARVEMDWPGAERIRLYVKGGQQAFVAAVLAVQDTLAAIHDGAVPQRFADKAAYEVLGRCIDDASWRQIIDTELGGQKS